MKQSRKIKTSLILLLLVPIVLVMAIGRVFAETPDTQQPWYPVSEFQLSYQFRGSDCLPDIAELMNIELSLGQNGFGYTISDEKSSLQTTLSKLSLDGLARYDLLAIKSIQDQLVKYLNSKGIGGVVVMPASGQIDLVNLTDLRPQNATAMPLKIDIWVARVASVAVNIQTDDSRQQEPNETDRYAGSVERVARYSPVSEVECSEPNSVTTDQLRTDVLEDYLFRLNRHPGRRVDVSVAPGGESGDVALEYNIRQNRPWLAYAQISNTGSKDTSDYRHRFGVVNNQFTGNDDIFNLDYLTTDFDHVNSLAMSYDRPFFGSETARYKLWLNWSDYISSEIGAISYFSGGETTFGFELSDNVWQKGRIFIDHFAGLRLSRYRIRNYIIDDEVIEASESFLVPQLGYRLEYDSGIRRTYGQIMLEASMTNNDSAEMQDFGRLRPASNWMKIGWDLTHSFYLEPVWDPQGWRDIKTPKTSTLAHELAFTTRGQWSPNRLIPQEKFSVGGLYSVRGYRQGYTSGDTVVILSGEYRYHIPRAFDISKPATLPILGSKFRWAPEQVYGFPDWDLILRTFLDSAFVINNDSTANEDNYYLSSCGLGLELQINRNFSLRCDWGVALQQERNNNGNTTDAGDSTVHISGMITY